MRRIKSASRPTLRGNTCSYNGNRGIGFYDGGSASSSGNIQSGNQYSISGGYGGGAPGATCFIATAAYGSGAERDVVTLRRFRDHWLYECAPGRAFISTYYRLSPPIADWLSTRPTARAVVRVALWPAVFVAGVMTGEPGPSLEKLIGIADRRLYSAKEAGRNRVVSAG